MRCMFSYLLPIVVGLLLLSCFNQRATMFPLGDYQYTGYSSKGDKIVEGKVSIISREGNRLAGKWRLKTIGDPKIIGPQVGEGNLEGELNQDRLIINLNPAASDSNVVLTGEIEGGRFHGKWSFDGFAGSMNQGLFEASRQ